MFAALQADFAAALLDPVRALPDGVTAHTRARPDKRFAVYRNNVVTGLIRALKTRFPAVMGVVGEVFFAAMAHAFVTAHPPRSPLLMVYGDDFPDFIAGFAPADDLPYLADLARIEAARTRAYHAADARALDPAELQALAPGELAAVRLTFHPSAEIVRSAHPVVTIWAMNSGIAEPAPIEDWRGEDALVLRPGDLVEVRKLPAGGAAFLAALSGGATLQAAAEAAVAECAAFDLPANLAGLIGSGLVTGLLRPDPTEDVEP
jgi:hypothetical protein